MQLVVIADTHLSGGIGERLPKALLQAIGTADCLLHAGDITSLVALSDFTASAPLRAVLGNNDGELVGLIPEELRFEIQGVRIAMLHDSGARVGRPQRMAHQFPDDALVVYGHSHIPDNSLTETGQVLFNPGSPTQRRSQPHPSFGRIEIRDGVIVTRKIEEL